MPLSTVFQSSHGDSSHYSWLSWVSPALGWISKVSCPRTLHQNPEDPVRFEPRTLDYESNGLQLSPAGPRLTIDKNLLLVQIERLCRRLKKFN